MGRLTQKALERLRDRTFRRLPHLRVKGERTALRFIEQVGFCFAFSPFGYDLPCLWAAIVGKRHPAFPDDPYHDPAIGLTWELKDRLPSKRLVYYGRLLKGKPTLVSLRYFPFFFALIRGEKGSGDYLADYRAGFLSRPAKTILDILHDEGPLDTPELRAKAGLRSPERTHEYERTMADLQRRLWIVKISERYEPTFSFRWDLVDNWLEKEVKIGRRIPREEAIVQIIQQYLSTVLYTTTGRIARLFDLPLSEVSRVVEHLSDRGIALPDQVIQGLKGRWLVHHTPTRK
ncbi:MAG: winged helix DNA-binding domain-containing protein [candidate division NC10 bacterium]|nr:winged helix DNA-binding domain-containing protein [candidate division NC10 bacterium]